MSMAEYDSLLLQVDLLPWINEETGTPNGGFLELFPVATQNVEDSLQDTLENIEGQIVTDASLGETQLFNLRIQ